MKQPSVPLYLYYDAAEGCFRTSGIPFRDYMQYTPAPPEHLLILAGDGLLFDPAEIRRTGQPVFHRVGAYRDMDRIINALAQLEARFPAEQLVL